MKVIVTIPAYNEEKTIGKVLEDVKKVMTSQKKDFSILVVDDGSTDQTMAISQRHGARLFLHYCSCLFASLQDY